MTVYVHTPDARHGGQCVACLSKPGHRQPLDIDQIVKVAGIDHVGVRSNFDGITVSPRGLEDVSSYPRLTEELLRRGYSEGDVHKILGANALRTFREAENVARRLTASTQPEVDEIKAERRQP